MFVVQVNLAKPLVSKIRISNKIRVEYESLLQICFRCGRSGHLREACHQEMIGDGTKGMGVVDLSTNVIVWTKENLKVQARVEKEEHGDWIVVERWCLRQQRLGSPILDLNQGNKMEGSRFNVLTKMG